MVSRRLNLHNVESKRPSGLRQVCQALLENRGGLKSTQNTSEAEVDRKNKSLAELGSGKNGKKDGRRLEKRVVQRRILLPALSSTKPPE